MASFFSHSKHLVASLAVAGLLSACAQNGQGGVTNPVTGQGLDKSDVGTLTGALAGAWIGSNTGKGKGKYAAIAAGTLLGGYLGNQIGASLDKADMTYYNETSQYALENAKTGQTSKWANPDSGHSGTITPTRTYETADGGYCREYSQVINVGGQKHDAYGTACRQQDGSWKIVQ